jgi:hypothetical protein
MSLAEVRESLTQIRGVRDILSKQVFSLEEQKERLQAEIAVHYQKALERKIAGNNEGAKRILALKIMKEKIIPDIDKKQGVLLSKDSELQRAEMKLQMRESALETEELVRSLETQQASAAGAAKTAEEELADLLAEFNTSRAAASSAAGTNTNTNENEGGTICNKLGRCFRRLTGRKKKTAGGKRKGKSMKARRRS